MKIVHLIIEHNIEDNVQQDLQTNISLDKLISKLNLKYPKVQIDYEFNYALTLQNNLALNKVHRNNVVSIFSIHTSS